MITVIDFYADWCGPCKVMKPIFEKLMPEYEGKVKFEKIDVESDVEKAQKFGVLSIPTFVIVKDEQEVARKVGAMPEQALRDWIESNLD